MLQSENVALDTKYSFAEIFEKISASQSYLKVISLCDFAITPNERLVPHLKSYVSEVLVNPYTSSEGMIAYAETCAKKEKKQSEYQKICFISYTKEDEQNLDAIHDVVLDLLKSNPRVRLTVATFDNHFSLSSELKETDQVEVIRYRDWKELFDIISQSRLNIIPSIDTIDSARTEAIKFIEASLLGVPTIASATPHVRSLIKNDEECVLCTHNEEWRSAIETLLSDGELHARLSKNSLKNAVRNHTSVYNAGKISRFVTANLRKHIGFNVAGTVIRGGINVIIKHANILRNHGYDVTLVSDNEDEKNIVNGDGELNVVSKVRHNVYCGFDKLVATLWITAFFVQDYAKAREKLYLVQGFETDFSPFGHPWRMLANTTYNSYQLQYLTISQWCRRWLKEEYGQESRFCPNGLDIKRFTPTKRDFTGKIIILIEGNCEDEFRNVDESFRITNELDPAKFEIWYMSYAEKPKNWYRVDRFLHQIPYSEVAKVYQGAHFLIKSSKLDSFSYPPIEMMATGGVAIVGLNDGNAEYVRHKENCMVYTIGEVETARNYIFEIIKDENLREQIIANGVKTAQSRDWTVIEKEIVDLYV
jgi:glycosyltransferase involved in cell wall biosynthesis